MIVVDVNLLLYAVNTESPEHPVASKWVSGAFSSEEIVALPWITLWGFLRVATNPRVWRHPKTSAEAFIHVREWLGLTNVVALEPGAHYAGVFERILTEHRITGPRVTDAALAALAIENGATLASTDRDFARFRELRWINPLDAAR